MAFSFDVASNIPRLNQSGTDTGLSGIATAINAVVSVGRSTAYTTAMLRKPPTPTGFWYRCSTAGTTAATAPTYGTTDGGTTTDGTSVWTAFKAPDIQTLGTTNHYYMPAVRMAINGTLTNSNPQQENFTCYDVIIYTGNFTSGSWATDGVTPRWDGVHFATVRTSGSGADGVSLALQAGGQFTFIGGEVQCANGVTFDNGTTPRSYYTRWRNTREYGASSARFRSYTTNAIFQNVETYDFAFDLFRMPTVAPSIKARGSEYVYQYVGSLAGGADAKFSASSLENVDGTYDFDNYSGGWVELYNCAKGETLNVVSQYPNSSVWVRHCVPLYQDIRITAKDTTGALLQNVRFNCTDSPTNSPTVTFTTVNSLKTWDFRNALSYETTTNASGIALSTPVLNVWYWQTSFKENLRFPLSTATYQGRAYNYKTMNVSVVLGSNSIQDVSAGMVSLDTATTVTESVAGALTGISLVPSGATGGVITISSNKSLQDIWNYYRYWISQFANKTSDDTWTCTGGVLNTGDWDVVIQNNVTKTNAINSIVTSGILTNNGTINFPFSDALGSRVSIIGLDPENFGVTWHLRYRTQAVGSTPAGAWTNVSGTGNSTTVLAEIATYDIMIRVPGYDWKTTEIDTNETLSLDASLDYHVSANNTPQYTMSFDATLEAAINFDYATNSVSIANTTGAIINPGFAEFYRATQRIQHIPALVWIWESPVTANSTSQKILIPTGNAISFFLTEDSNASVKATCPVIHQASGQSADDRVKGNASGYSIILGSPATAESAGLQSAIVSELLEKLGGENYAVGTDSLKKIKDQLNAVKTKVDTLENTDLSEVALEATSQSIKSTVEAIQTFDSEELMPTIYAIQSQQNVIIYDQGDMIKAIQSANENFNPVTDSLSAISDAIDVLKLLVEDKTGYSLTTEQVEAIAVAVESHLLDEGDSQKLIEAIVGAIGNANIDETVLVAAIRSDLERVGGKLDAIETSVDLIENYDDSTLVAKINAIKAVVDGIENYDDATLIAKVNAIKTELDALENYNDTALIAKVDAIKTVVDALENYNDAPTQTKLDAIKTAVDALENTDISGLPSATDVKETLRPLLTVINDGVKKASKIKTHKTNLPE